MMLDLFPCWPCTAGGYASSIYVGLGAIKGLGVLELGSGFDISCSCGSSWISEQMKTWTSAVRLNGVTELLD